MGRTKTIDDFLFEQRGVVAAWQLQKDEWSEREIRSAVSHLRTMHDGVHLSGHAPPTPWQLWKAAELTAPDTRLGSWSGAALHGFRDRNRLPTTVVRPGTRGTHLTKQHRKKTADHLAQLKVHYSKAFLEEDTTGKDDIATLSAARILLDLIPHLSEDKAKRHVRDALRLKAVTPLELTAVTAKHHGRRGVARLKGYVDIYASLPFDRTRSDAEILAAELIAAAGMPAPLVNVKVAGEEGDLVYVEYGRIIELDGPQFHLFEAEDARKQRIWEQAGWEVDRLSTDVVYDEPHKLLALVPHLGDPLRPLSVHLPSDSRP